MVTAADVELALQTLYHNSDSTAKANANLWLISFQKDSAAWQLSLDLLRSQAVEIQHFGAQTLYIKISQQWNELPGLEARTSLRTVLMSGLPQFASGFPAVRTRLCLCVASIAVRMMPEEWPDVFSSIASLASSAGQSEHTLSRLRALTMEVLSLMPEEFERLVVSSNRRDDVRQLFQRTGASTTASLCHNVLMGGVPGPGPGGGPSSADVVAALVCLLNWLSYFPTRELSHGWIPQAAFAALTNPGLSTAACDLLEGIIPFSVEKGGEEAFKVFATSAIALGPYLSSGDSQLLEGICRVVSAVASCGAESIVSNFDEKMVNLIQIVLRCTSCSPFQLCHLTLEFWDELRRRVVEQDAQFQFLRVFTNLVHVLLCQASYPAEAFDESRDEDEWNEFRRDVSDTLLSAFEVLGGTYFELLSDKLSKLDGNRWQDLEVILFGLRAVAESLDETGDGSVSAVGSAVSPNVAGFLRDLFKHIPLWVNPAVPVPLLKAAVSLVGAYGPWMDKQGPEVAVAALDYLALCLGIPAVRQSAARAVRELCRECGKVLGSSERVVEWNETLVPILSSAITNLPDLNDRLSLAEAAASVAAKHPPEVVKASVERLLNPIVQRIQELMPREVVGSSYSNPALPAELRVLSSAIRGLDFGTASAVTGAEALKPLFSLLAAVTANASTNDVIMQAVCSVYKNLFVRVGPVLDASNWLAVDSLVQCFTRVSLACILEAAASAVGVEGAPLALRTALVQRILPQIVEHSVSQLQPDPRRRPDLVEAMFRFLLKVVEHCPEALLSSPSCPMTLAAAMASLSLQEREAGRAVADFLSGFLELDRVQAWKASVTAILQSYGRPLVHHILAAVAGKVLSTVVPQLAEALYLLAMEHPQELASWSHDALFSADLAPLLTALCEQDRVAFIRAMPNLRQRRRFRAFVVELSKVCRGEMMPDALLAYQM